MLPGTPHNGTKTHPLKPGALTVLHMLSRAPVIASAINPGVRDRLTRGAPSEHLATEVMLPNPFGRKGTVKHYQITPAGLAALEASKPR